MDAKLFHQTRRYMRLESLKFPVDKFVEIPIRQWPVMRFGTPPDKVLRSRKFLVEIFNGKFTRLSICRTEIQNDGRFVDGITWDELQEVKNMCGFEDCDAVECYPKRVDVVNVANFRHLWIVPAEFSEFFWRKNK